MNFKNNPSRFSILALILDIPFYLICFWLLLYVMYDALQIKIPLIDYAAAETFDLIMNTIPLIGLCLLIITAFILSIIGMKKSPKKGLKISAFVLALVALLIIIGLLVILYILYLTMSLLFTYFTVDFIDFLRSLADMG